MRYLQLLAIPFTLLSYVATILILPFYRPTSIRWHDGCLELIAGRKTSKDVYDPGQSRTRIWGRPGGQSWGIRVIWYASKGALDTASLRVHERVHVLHGEWVNACAHTALVPMSFALGGGWWTVGAVAISQLAFGITYLGHFLFEWARLGGGP